MAVTPAGPFYSVAHPIERLVVQLENESLTLDFKLHDFGSNAFSLHITFRKTCRHSDPDPRVTRPACPALKKFKGSRGQAFAETKLLA